MKKNVGNVDRVLRILIAFFILVLYAINVLQGFLGVILLILAGVFVLTSSIKFCPLYGLLGISTRKRKYT